MVQRIPIKIEIDDAALDAAQAKADKLEFTLEKIRVRLDMLAGVAPKTPEDEARRKLIRWLDGLDKIVSQAQEKPPEDGKEHVSPDSYREHPHAWNPNSWSTDNLDQTKGSRN